MKVTNGDLYMAVIGNDDTPHPLSILIKKELPISTSAKLNRLAQKLMPEVKAISESKETLIRQYGTEKDGRTSIQQTIEKVDESGKACGIIPNPQWPSFVNDFNDLMNQEIEVDLGNDWATIKLPLELLEKKGICVSGAVLLALEKFVEVA